MNYEIRRLVEDDWQTLREIRLQALATDPSVFGSNYARESAFAEADWRGWLAADTSAIFMLFCDDRPIGMTAISVDREDASGRTGFLWGTWLDPGHRRRGLSALFYEARLVWARDRASIERLTVSHRASNESSKFANQKFGFVYTHSTEKTWNDGLKEPELHYELRL